MMRAWRDLRVIARALARSRGFTLTVIVIIALALAANTLVFSVMNAVLLGALPYPEAGRIFDVGVLPPPGSGEAGRRANLDDSTFRAWRESEKTLEAIAAHRRGFTVLTGAGEPVRLPSGQISPGMLQVLGVLPAHGRGFEDTDGVAGAEPVAILSHGFWQRRFGGEPDAIGGRVILDGVAHTVVGVMPAGFFFPDREVEVWTPLTLASDTGASREAIQVEYLPVVVRLLPGVTREQAELEAETLLRRLVAAGVLPGDEASAGRVELVRLDQALVATVRPALLATMASVALVLLIACANLASLFLARNAAREHETAVRLALGSPRLALLWRTLGESLLLGLAGGTVGWFLVIWLHRLLPHLVPIDVPRLEEIRLDLRVFLFALGASVVTGLLSGLLAALRSARTPMVMSVHGAEAELVTTSRLHRAFVMAQVASAVVLLVGAGLLLQSFLRLVQVEPGFDSRRVLTTRVDLATAPGAPPGDVFFDQSLERVQEHPDVEAAGVVSHPPFTAGFTLVSLELPGQPPGRRTVAVPQLVSPGYFQAVGVRLVEGRWLSEREHEQAAPVALVNQIFAQRYLAGQQVLGQRIETAGASLEIIGVVADVRLLGLASEPKPEVFASYHHASPNPGPLTLAVRTKNEPSALAPFLRSVLRELVPGLPLEDMTTLEQQLSASVARPRFYALLLSAFAVLALLLAGAGIYAILSYSVAQQTRRIGIRRALGAQKRDVLAMVVKEGMTQVGWGLAIGFAIALPATRVLEHLLFGISRQDLGTYAAAVGILAVVALMACYLPARRATRVDPMVALRGG